MTKTIILASGDEALVDDEDYERVNKLKWHLDGNGYARHVFGKNGKAILMHRMILDVPKGMQTDHINGNTLDNRRVNLRIVTRQENLCNRRSWSKYGYKGVSPNKKKGNWRVRFSMDFDTPEEAARAYDTIARIFFGEHAQLNFPNRE